jgi:DNA ligase (NAD+)
VLVERAGDVIPHVVEVLTARRNGRERRYELPRTCPSCGGEVTRPAGEVIARCTNAACPAQRQATLQHFGAQDALDIDGLGDRLVEQLVERELVSDPADLFDLTVDDLVPLDRMAEKRAQNLVEAIDEAKRRATLPRLIFALGIPHVGRSAAGALARAFGSLDAVAGADADDLEAVDDVGPTMASAIAQWFDNDRNRRLIDRLRQRGLDPQAEPAGDRLEGLTFVLTGELESMTRDEAQDAIRRQGGRASSRVSARTDYLVVGADPGRTKTRDADEHDVQTLDERRFLELLGRDS